MTAKADNARALYMEGIRDGRCREAVTQYTGARYTQHSTGVADGVEGFVAFFEPFVQRTPERDIRVVRCIEDGQYVFCHATQDLNRGEARWVTMDLFDTDDDDKIIEHWDVIAPWVEADQAGRSQTGGETQVRDLDETAANKARVKDFVESALIGGERRDWHEFVAEDLVQHDLEIADGAGAWAAHLASAQSAGKPIAYREIFRLIGQGNFVVTYCKVDIGSEPWAVFDLFRLEGGRIAERWVNAEVVPADTGNGGKF